MYLYNIVKEITELKIEKLLADQRKLESELKAKDKEKQKSSLNSSQEGVVDLKPNTRGSFPYSQHLTNEKLSVTITPSTPSQHYSHKSSLYPQFPQIQNQPLAPSFPYGFPQMMPPARHIQQQQQQLTQLGPPHMSQQQQQQSRAMMFQQSPGPGPQAIQQSASPYRVVNEEPTPSTDPMGMLSVNPVAAELSVSRRSKRRRNSKDADKLGGAVPGSLRPTDGAEGPPPFDSVRHMKEYNANVSMQREASGAAKGESLKQNIPGQQVSVRSNSKRRSSGGRRSITN